MNKFSVTMAVIILGGAGAVLWLQYSQNGRLRSENEVLKAVIDGLKGFQDVRTPAAAGGLLTAEQLDELLKLRSEVTQLRGQTNLIGALIETNRKLAASLESKPADVAKKKGPEDALPQDIHPRASWAFRGYGSPDDTLESIFWAEANNDRTRLAAAMAPELRAQWEKQSDEVDISDKDTLEFRIMERRTLSDDLVVLTVYAGQKYPASENHNTQNVFFKRVDGEWRVADAAVTPK